jgi:hypothetical protein
VAHEPINIPDLKSGAFKRSRAPQQFTPFFLILGAFRFNIDASSQSEASSPRTSAFAIARRSMT